MKQKLLILPILVSLLGTLLPLQAQVRRSCSTMEHLSRQIEANPAIIYKMRDVERRTAENARSGRGDMLGVITIPVVVHVVYSQANQNITDEQIRSQIQVLNQDFGRSNPDRFKTPISFQDVAASTKIAFRLASLDPNGNSTNGITRNQTHISMFSPSTNGIKYSAMGGVDSWDPDSYLNIWVCRLGAGMLGYAQFPGGGPKETDGVVIDFKFFGTTGTVRAPFDKGRTCTHEVGHWLNLKHIWGDGPCETDDFVQDTPPVADAHYGGPVPNAIACDGGPAMVSNYMDYTDDAYMNLFTRGQAERMRALFGPGGSRRKILSNNAAAQYSALASSTSPEIASPPQLLNATEVTDLSARLSWSPVSGAETYTARFRIVGGSDWFSKSFDRTYVNATRLDACTSYEFQIQSVIDGVESGFSDSKVFRTSGCAGNSPPIVGVSNAESQLLYPTNLFISDELGGQARLNWGLVNQAVNYKVQYKASGSQKVYGRTISGSFVGVSGLSRGVRYFYRVRANFTDGSHGPYSEVKSFVAGRSGTARMISKNTEDDYFSVAMQNQEAEVRFDLGVSSSITIEIIDAQGEVSIAYDPFFLQAGEPLQLDLGELSPGDYDMRITDGDGFNHTRSFRR